MKTKLITTLLTIAAASTALFAADSPAVGTNAPDFSLTDSKGKTQSVSQYKGKYVVLEWFNPECPFVKKHYGSGNMQKLQDEFTGKGIVWLTIDSSAPGKEGNLSAEQANAKMAEWKSVRPKAYPVTGLPARFCDHSELRPQPIGNSAGDLCRRLVRDWKH